MLDRIKNPSDLKQLSHEELNLLCQVDRGISVTSHTGGHVGPNQIVELTVALHLAFNSLMIPSSGMYQSDMFTNFTQKRRAIRKA